MQMNDSVSIVLASGRNVVANTMLVAAVRGEIIEATDKAIKVEATTRNGKPVSAWFPRKALRQIGDSAPLAGSNSHHFTTQIQHWFRPSGWTARFIDIATECST
jgi:hypothetical protein